MSARLHVVDITESNFEAEIVEASMTRPVLVDFWATWCGPCKTLGPMLEDLATSYGGAFRLAKVDVDANPTLASQFGAQSIPMVFALFKGELVDRFTGVLPKQDLTRFVDSVLERCGAGAPADADAEPEALSAEDHEAALKAKLESHPDDGDALLALGRLEMERGRPDPAREFLNRIPVAVGTYTQGQALLAALGLLAHVEAAGNESVLRDRLAADPDSGEARFGVACADGARGRFERALEALVAVVASGDSALVKPAKEASSILFQAAGRGDEGIEGLRRKLTKLLF
jgi:putative thioredoxin